MRSVCVNRMISMVFTNNLVIPLHVLYVVILLIAPGWRFVVAVVPRMLLIPTGDGADRPLLPQLGIGDVVWSLSLVVFVHLSELKLEFLVGYLKREATWTRSRTNTLVSLILFQGMLLTLECTMARVSTHTRHPPYSCLIAWCRSMRNNEYTMSEIFCSSVFFGWM